MHNTAIVIRFFILLSLLVGSEHTNAQLFDDFSDGDFASTIQRRNIRPTAIGKLELGDRGQPHIAKQANYPLGQGKGLVWAGRHRK